MAANTQAFCGAFKVQLLEGVFNLNVGAHVIKAALYFQNQGIGVSTSVYTTTGEVTGTNYTAGGIVVANATGPQLTSGTAFWTPSANLVWNNLTVSSPFDCVLFYDVTAGSAAMASLIFPAQTANASQFVIGLPANISTAALFQLN